MLNKKQFQKMASDMANIDEKREEIIKHSRDILKLSKQAIYDIHRNDLNYAKQKIKSAEDEIKNLRKLFTKNKDLNVIGAFNAALEEWTEAYCYYEFCKNSKIPAKTELGIKTETYLGGLSDLTGELSRRAVNLAIKRKKNDVKIIKDTIEEIYGHFLKFNLRNGELRKKSDSIKWNLKKVEEVLYDLERKN